MVRAPRVVVGYPWNATAAPSREAMNPLAGKPLRYLIGADNDRIVIDPAAFTVLPYDYEKRIADPQRAGGYGNLYWQEGAPDCRPYLKNSDTAEQYGERVINPMGKGWGKNLDWQFNRWRKLGALYIELDNADGYTIADVLDALNRADRAGFRVFAKNPWNLRGRGTSLQYVTHPAVCGMIIERDGGNVLEMDALRRHAGKPDLPLWFVSFGRGGRSWAMDMAQQAMRFRNVGVTHSTRGEYASSEDILRPKA